MSEKMSLKVEAALFHGLIVFLCVMWFPFRIERFDGNWDFVIFYAPTVIAASAAAFYFYNSRSFSLAPARFYARTTGCSVGIVVFSYLISTVILSLIMYLISPDSPGHRGTTLLDAWYSTSFFIFWLFFATWPAWLAGHFVIFGLLAFRYQRFRHHLRSAEAANA